MSKITKNERLPSCEVNIVLLKELENYFNNELPNIFYNKRDYLELDYSILIEDNFASEIFRSIDEYYSQIFTNSTTKISISVNIKNSDIVENYIKERNIDRSVLKEEDYVLIKEIKEAIPYVNIDIVFRKSVLDDNIRISYDGKNARAMVIAVYDAVIRIIEPYKNHNSLYNPKDFALGLIVVGSFIFSPLIFIYLMASGYKMLGIIVISISLIGILYCTLGRRTHPYFGFDSKKSAKYKRWNNWFIYNAMFIILVDIVLIILRKFDFP